jgi:tungstate transport system ATP-binding protein
MLYSLKQIIQRYRRRKVLDIDFLEIQEGNIYALLGPNGAGKTTLLNILGFLEAPANGKLFFQGQLVETGRIAMQRLRRKVVLVDQHPIMFSTSVCRNIEFGLRIRNIEKGVRRRIIDEVLATVGLTSFKDAAAHELSGGETQRLALARALALSPAVLLCDEPTASVDAENQTVIGALLQKINQSQGTTIIFTTHDRLQAAALAHQTVVLESGKIAPTTYENCFTCTISRGEKNEMWCVLYGGAEIPLLVHNSLCHLDAARVYIDPEKIQLNRLGELSGTDKFVAGKVVLVMAEGEKVRVVVNIGVLMVVLMDYHEYQQTRPDIGDVVYLRFATDTVSIIGG